MHWAKIMKGYFHAEAHKMHVSIPALRARRLPIGSKLAAREALRVVAVCGQKLPLPCVRARCTCFFKIAKAW